MRNKGADHRCGALQVWIVRGSGDDVVNQRDQRYARTSGGAESATARDNTLASRRLAAFAQRVFISLIAGVDGCNTANPRQAQNSSVSLNEVSAYDGRSRLKASTAFDSHTAVDRRVVTPRSSIAGVRMG